jgi:hypothetical protein
MPVGFDMSEAFTEFTPDLVHNLLLIEKALIMAAPQGTVVCTEMWWLALGTAVTLGFMVFMPKENRRPTLAVL